MPVPSCAVKRVGSKSAVVVDHISLKLNDLDRVQHPRWLLIGRSDARNHTTITGIAPMAIVRSNRNWKVPTQPTVSQHIKGRIDDKNSKLETTRMSSLVGRADTRRFRYETP